MVSAAMFVRILGDRLARPLLRPTLVVEIPGYNHLKWIPDHHDVSRIVAHTRLCKRPDSLHIMQASRATESFDHAREKRGSRLVIGPENHMETERFEWKQKKQEKDTRIHLLLCQMEGI
jgi:hypothetical protein